MDILGLPHALMLTPANVTDRAGAIDMVRYYPLFPYYDYALGAGTPKAVSILRIAGLSSVCNAP